MLHDLADEAHRHVRVGQVARDLVQLAEPSQLVRGRLVPVVRREAERIPVAEQALGDGPADALVRSGERATRTPGLSPISGARIPPLRRRVLERGRRVAVLAPRRSISSDAAAPERGNSSPSRSQSAAARA